MTLNISLTEENVVLHGTKSCGACVILLQLLQLIESSPLEAYSHLCPLGASQCNCTCIGVASYFPLGVGGMLQIGLCNFPCVYVEDHKKKRSSSSNLLLFALIVLIYAKNLPLTTSLIASLEQPTVLLEYLDGHQK